MFTLHPLKQAGGVPRGELPWHTSKFAGLEL